MARILEDALQLKVKVNNSVDEQTANECMALLRIYAKERKFDALFLRVDDAYFTGYQCEGIHIEEEDSCPYCRRRY